MSVSFEGLLLSDWSDASSQVRQADAEKCADETILDLLDALEAAIGKVRTGSGSVRGREAAQHQEGAQRRGLPPHAFRREMERVGVSEAEFASLFGYTPEVVQAWLAGTSVVPCWVAASLRILGQLTPGARRKLLNRPDPKNRCVASRTHPFSRIEEL